MFCPAFQWIYLWIVSLSVKKHHVPTLLSVASGDSHLLFMFFIGELGCGTFIIMDEFPFWEWSFVVPTLSGILLPSRRKRQQRKRVDAYAKQENQAIVLSLGMAVDSIRYIFKSSHIFIASDTESRPSVAMIPFHCCCGFSPIRQEFLQKFLQTFSVKVHMLLTQSCPTLCNPMDFSPPGSSVCGIL